MAEKTQESPELAAQAAEDRRDNPRYKFSAPAEVVEPKSGKRIEARVSELGREGCFLDTGNPFPLGTVVNLRITKGAKIFEAEARVVYSSQDKGMGLFFTAVEPAKHEVVAEWLASSLETSWLASTRRRSQRILVKIPVRVMGKNSHGLPFEEETFTQAASAHGGLILLSATVAKSQRLTLANERTKTSLECIVAHIGDVQGNQVQIGVAFILPNPGFWNATFPPEDWSVRHPDAKTEPTVPFKRTEELSK